MRKRWFGYPANRHLAILLCGSLFFLGGCDPTIRATVENGLITTSTSLFGAILRAMFELAAEQQANTAKALINAVQPWIA